MAANCFKQYLLGDLHVPGKHQTQAVFDALSGLPHEFGISERTWQSWFAGQDVVPKSSKVSQLDRMSSALDGFRGDQAGLPNGFFLSMVQGGLANLLLAQTESQKPLQALRGRAADYQPQSMLHLHLDAIRINTLVADVSQVGWSQLMRTGAQRIFEILHQKWNPRSGWVYRTLPSHFRLVWDCASEVEQRSIRAQYEQFHPSPFERMYEAGAWPKWDVCGIESDMSSQHVFKLLLGLAADAEFLVSSRFENWYLDLCSAGLALHAYVMSDRYSHFGAHVTSEVVFLRAFEEIFFSRGDSELDLQTVVAAFELGHSEWTEDSLRLLLGARQGYLLTLHDFDLSGPEIHYLANASWRTHPLVYRA